jgi:hypothetical protein
LVFCFKGSLYEFSFYKNDNFNRMISRKRDRTKLGDVAVQQSERVSFFFAGLAAKLHRRLGGIGNCRAQHPMVVKA